MNLRRASTYGRIGVASLPSEVLKIWYSKDADPEPCEPIDSYWPTATDPELLLAQDLARRLVAATPLTESEQKVIALCVLDNYTTREAGAMLGVTQSRVHQLLHRALRRFRDHSVKLTGQHRDSIDDRVMPWHWWHWEQKSKRARMVSGMPC